MILLKLCLKSANLDPFHPYPKPTIELQNPIICISIEYVVTAEDLEERNPIIVSNQPVDISEDGKALL